MMGTTSNSLHSPDRRGRLRFPHRWILPRLTLLFILFLPIKTFPVPPTPKPEVPLLADPVLEVGIIAAPEYSGCGGQFPNAINAAYEQQVVELVNAERAIVELPPLKRVTPLDQAARYHAADMYLDNYPTLQHDSYDRVNGNLVWSCAWSTRISSFYSNWNALGENIARGYATPQAVMAGWMASPGHHDNILGPSYKEIGVGYYSGNHWVQDFGARSGIYPIVINREAAETDDRNVSLYVYGNTATWTEMRLKNAGLTWTSWMPFQNNVAWQLPDAVGTHTVTAELRKGSTTASSSDSIYLSVVSVPTLGNLTESLVFTYSIADASFQPQQMLLTPLNLTNELPLSWDTASDGGWFMITPETGVTPGSFTIIPQGSYTHPGSQTGIVTVIVTNPSGTGGSPHTIDLTLRIVDGPFTFSYLPLLLDAIP